MKKMILCLLVALTLTSISFAQTGSVIGKIVNEDSEPVVGANVIVSGTSFGSATDLEGLFKIKDVPFGSYTIEVSYIGYRKTISDVFRLNESEYEVTLVLIEEAIETGQVIVTAGKYRQRVEDLPVSAIVVSTSILSKKNFTSLDDALRYVPGVNMTLEQVSIRGSSGYSKGAGTRVLVAQDGIPLYTGDTGEIIWEQVPITDIERIEIIKGPASSLYGSTAIGGVINIITKKAVKKPLTYFKSFVGAYDKPSYDEWDWFDDYRTFYGVELSHSNSAGKFGYSFSVKKLMDDSYRKDDFNRRIIGYTKLSYQFTEDNSLSISANYIDMNRGNFLYWKDSQNALIQNESDQFKTVESKRLFLSGIYSHKFNETVTAELKSSYYNSKFDGYGLETTSSKAVLFRNELLTNFTLSEKFRLVAGTEISTATVESNMFSNPDFFTAAGYFQAEYRGIKNLIATFGMRYDYIKLDTLLGANAFTPKIGVNYKLFKDVTLRASAGAGFRAPTPAEVFTTTDVGMGVTVIENPDLEAETSISFEVGARYIPTESLNFDIALFHTEYDNFIEATLQPSGDIQFLNITEAKIQGVELVSEYEPVENLIKLTAGYTYLWARDINLNKAMKYRPRHLLYLSSEYNPNPFEFRADFRYWSRVEEIDDLLTQPPINLVPDGELRVPVYVFDVSIGYNFFLFKAPLKVYFNAKNLFNYYYVEFIGNLAPIRNISLSLEAYL